MCEYVREKASETMRDIEKPVEGLHVCVCVFVFTWLRVAEYSGLTGRKGTALRSVTRVLWFWVVSHTNTTEREREREREREEKILHLMLIRNKLKAI